MCLEGLIEIHNENKQEQIGNLFAQPISLCNFLELDDNFSVSVFSGRHAGFYYSPCMADFTKPMLSIFASMHQYHLNSSSKILKLIKFASSFVGYLVNPEKRAIDTKNATCNGDIVFLRVS